MDYHIVIISFTSSINSIQQWKEETRCFFDIYCDSNRVLYRYLEFPSDAFSRVWNIEVLDYYVEQKLKGIILPNPIDPNDDPNQMGGNLIVNQNGQILFLYRSRSPTDRPTIQQLLNY